MIHFTFEKTVEKSVSARHLPGWNLVTTWLTASCGFRRQRWVGSIWAEIMGKSWKIMGKIMEKPFIFDVVWCFLMFLMFFVVLSMFFLEVSGVFWKFQVFLQQPKTFPISTHSRRTRPTVAPGHSATLSETWCWGIYVRIRWIYVEFDGFII